MTYTFDRDFDSLLDRAAYESADAYEFVDEDPTFDPDYAWLDEASDDTDLGWVPSDEDSWVSDCISDSDGGW